MGTRFDDRLRTDNGDDVIEAGAGSDAVDAGYGNDTITPGPGRDTVLADGGAGACDGISCPLPQGNDTINAADGEVDNISCGPGTDTVFADASDVLASDCERRTGGDGGGTPSPGTPGKVSLKVTRVKLAQALRRGLKVQLTGVTGTVRVTAKRGRSVVARGSARAKYGKATVTLRFTPKARRALRAKRKVSLKISGAGAAKTITLSR